MMAPINKLEDKLEGVENFLAWKYMIGLILRENGLDKYIKDEIAEPTVVEGREKHEQDLVISMRSLLTLLKIT